MGRPYASELRELDATYDWSLRAPIDDLAHSITRLANVGTLIVGSGGSLTAAYFGAFLHGHFAGRPAQALTPYEFASLERVLDDSGVLICSASGRNPDVISAARLALKRAPAHLVAVTTRPGSPLQREFERAEWPRCHAFPTPSKRDGFLATNSLLATLVLLIRAYEQCAASPSCLPSTLDDLVHAGMPRGEFLDRLRADTASLVKRPTLVVLHGAETKPAALDIESRFTEAALASVQPADYRNFAHGRHHWLARHATSTGVLAFGAERDRLAHKTLALLPGAIPQWQVQVAPGLRGALAAVCHSFLLALVAGEANEFDPGRPHVPAFGRKLYHLRGIPCPMGKPGTQTERMNFSIERKARLPLSALAARNQLDRWSGYYRAFVGRLAAARIRAIAVDYDGTLCGPARRFIGPSRAMLNRVNALLRAGYIVGIATGRGMSVREALRKHIRLGAHRRRVMIAYHNGAEIGWLADDDCPPSAPPLGFELLPIAAALRDSPVVCENASVDAKGHQISIELKPGGDASAVLDEAMLAVRPYATSGISVVTSGHSVDVIGRGVTKLNLVSRLVQDLELSDGGAASVLCIGDRGRAPGNDADFLRHPLSLSVDEPSTDPLTCWNLAEPGARFEHACLEYLRRLRPTGSGLRFDTRGVRP